MGEPTLRECPMCSGAGIVRAPATREEPGGLTRDELRVFGEGVIALRQKAERCAEDGVHPEAELWSDDADALHRLLNRLAARPAPGPQRTTPDALRAWAEWFDDPDESPPVTVHEDRAYTPGYLLRRIAEALESVVCGGLYTAESRDEADALASATDKEGHPVRSCFTCWHGEVRRTALLRTDRADPDPEPSCDP